ncbi:CLN3 protein [Ancylostoma caninum]|uniref:Battenin n=1 Tax=Ancylostoma caninum TaxID=29170 RepID=A0A368FSW1_ANCCA|nr:CLN3 protein [Ancylostoma caninum]
MAGLAGTFSYAVLTDVNLLGLTPTNAMLVMLIVPISFTFSYYCLLVRAPTVPAISACNPTTWLDLSTPYKRDIDKDSCSDVEVKGAVGKDVKLEAQNRPIEEQLMVIKDLMKYMIPFGTVYFMQYFIKQGLVDPSIREFALSTVTFADTIGILAAAVAAIPVHNWVCSMQWYG